MRRVLSVVVLALAGVGTAALLAASSGASAWNLGALPGDCHQDGSLTTTPGPTYSYWVKCGNDRTLLTYGSNPYPDAPTDDSFQGNLDAFVDVHYTAPTTTASPTTAATTTTAPATTTDAGAATTGPAVTTTVTQTVAQPSGTTTYITVTTLTPVEQSLQGQIDALAAQLKALTDRVTRLEKAGDASWLAFQQAVARGATVADAADQARGTWLNIVNQLGAYAPA